MEQLNDILDAAIELLIVLSPVLIGILTMFIKNVWVRAQMMLPDTWETVLENAAYHGVNFAEKLFENNVINATQRKMEAIDAAITYLEGAGYDIERTRIEGLLDTVIESTVKEINRNRIMR